MDLRQIMYFMGVYEEASFTKAARKVGVVQPALSRQISSTSVSTFVIPFLYSKWSYTNFESLCAISKGLNNLSSWALIEAETSGNISCDFRIRKSINGNWSLIEARFSHCSTAVSLSSGRITGSTVTSISD